MKNRYMKFGILSAFIRRIGPDKGGCWEVTGQKLLCEKQENIA